MSSCNLNPCRASLCALLVVASSVLGLPWPSEIGAQETLVKLGKEQEELLRKGVEATDKGQYDKALQFYRAALSFGEVNVAFMGMGRTHQKAGQCEEAEANFKKALEAPAVATPSPDQIRAAIEGYRAEMVELCPGKLFVNCDPPEMSLTVDGKPAQCGEGLKLTAGEHRIEGRAFEKVAMQAVKIVGMKTSEVLLVIEAPRARLTVACDPPEMALMVDEKIERCGEVLELKPGEHVLKGRVGDRVEERRVKLVDGENQKISLSLAPLEEVVVGVEGTPEPESEPEPEPEAGDGSTGLGSGLGKGGRDGGGGEVGGGGSGRRAWGWTLVVVGGGLMATGGVMASLVQGVNEDIEVLSTQNVIDPDEVESLRAEAETFQSVEFVGLGVGAASLLVGVILVAGAEESVKEGAGGEGVGLMPWLGPGTAGVSWRGAWW